LLEIALYYISKCLLEVVVRRQILFTLIASTALVFLSASPSMELTGGGASSNGASNGVSSTAIASLSPGSYNVSTPGSSGGGSGGNDYVCSQAGLPGGASATFSNGELTLS
jgi:hypothetical protein